MNQQEQFKIIAQEDGDEVAIYDPKFKQKNSEKIYDILIRQSNIPTYYWNIEFEDYKGDKSLESVEKIIYYAEHFNEEQFNHTHLYLWGNNSSQKTALAINVGKAALRKGYSVKFILAGTLIDKLLKTQGFSYHQEIEDEIRSLKKHNILIIDDIFDEKKSLFWAKENSSNYIISAWDSFLRDLISNHTKLICTSNVPIQFIEEKFGTSLYELIDRNFLSFGCYDNIKRERKKQFENLFDGKLKENEIIKKIRKNS